MEFALTEEQRMLDDSLRGALARALPLDRLKEIAKEGRGFSDELWGSMSEMGLAGVLVPDEQGGTGLGMLDAAVAAEALGYYGAPVPFVGPAVMAPLAVRLAGDRDAQARWLPRMASGEVRAAVAFAGGTGQTGVAEAALAGDRLSGRIDGVLDVAGATHVAVVLGDGRVGLVEAGADGVRVALKPTLDRTRPIGDVILEGARAELLEAANDPVATRARVLDAGRVILAADTLGAAQSMLDKAVAYAGDRVQFGRPIATFQAIKHMCADMATRLEPCRAFVWYAAHAQDAIPEEAHVVACHVKAHLAEVGRQIQTTATEVHGGMGFTELMGLQLWYKRISLDRHMLGGPERCRADAAKAQGWAAA
jgi:alkylation response protein AidB-like acyl-CoA dehydrogenase